MACIGIDFGVATCMAAVCGSDGPRVIKDDHGNEIVNSSFGIDPKTKKPVVGEKVKNIFQSAPSLAVEQIQRRMGDDGEISLGSEEVASQKLSPEEIAAHLFRHLKRSAEAQLEEEVDRCVITVPANFPDPARRATQQAGKIAGMTVERIINEPIAAALAYGHDEGIEEEYVMVYDLGGSTFDVSIVKQMGDVFDVEASSGDMQLGGKDFDEALLWHVAEKFEKGRGFALEPGSDNYYRLLFECEAAKKDLSFNRRMSVQIPFFTVKDGNPIDLDVEITRSTFESLISDKIDATGASIAKVLKEAGLSPSEIDQVVLVGGSTRIPYVQQHVEEVMGQSPKKRIDPDKAVALGAAVQSAIIDGKTDNVIMDVCPFSLGTAAVEMRQGGVRPGQYAEIISPNSKVLQPHTFTMKTEHRNQDSIELPLYQRANRSDSKQAEIDGEPNEEGGFTFLGNFEIDMPPGPAGQEVRFTFVYNPDGMLDVTAEIVRTGREITFHAHAGMDEGQVKQARHKLEQAWKESDYYEDVRALFQVAKDELDSDMEAEKEERLRSLMEEFKRALSENDGERVRTFEEKITDVLFNLL